MGISWPSGAREMDGLGVRLGEPHAGMQGLTLATVWGYSSSSFSFLCPAETPEHTKVCHWPFLPLPNPSVATDLKAGAAFYNRSHQRSRKHTRTPSLLAYGPTSTPTGPVAMDKESSARLCTTPPHVFVKRCPNKCSNSQPHWLLFPALTAFTCGQTKCIYIWSNKTKCHFLPISDQQRSLMSFAGVGTPLHEQLHWLQQSPTA